MMKNELNTDEVISNMVSTLCSHGATAREKHMYRETLRNLVRLAKAEQMAEMRANVERLTVGVHAQLFPSNAKPGEGQLEVNRN